MNEQEVFRDSDQSPEMVVVPPGAFQMGCASGGEGVTPLHKVQIERPFAVGTCPVTFDEYDFFNDREKPEDEAWGRGDKPVINVSWDDAVAFTRSLSKACNAVYRLPSEAEWEYVARAGTTTAFWWGDEKAWHRANCSNCGTPWSNRQTSPVKSFAKNQFGLYDTVGNVSEWCEDWYHKNYVNAPEDGTPWLTGKTRLRNFKVVRGGSCFVHEKFAYAFERGHYPHDEILNDIGFRVVRELQRWK